MSTIGIGNGSAAAQAVAATSSPMTKAQKETAEGNAAVQSFLNYMKETPAQRMEDAWLAAHGLTQKELDAMSPAQRLAVQKQMADDIKTEIEKKMGTASNSGASIGVTATS